MMFYRTMQERSKLLRRSVTLVVAMVHSTLHSFTMTSLDHLVTDLQEEVAR